MPSSDGPTSFAATLLRFRARASLSQEELAERAALSRRGISDLERGTRRTPYPETVRRLADALNLGSTDRAELQASAHPAAAVVSPAAAQPQPVRIPLTSFIGREPELAAVRRLLEDNRLVTLTGPGGIGKTRLALEALRVIGDVAFVDLAPLDHGGLLYEAVATALGVREQSRVSWRDLLVAALLRRHPLLVLDNCEHLIAACSEVADQLLHACPQLHILATSRQPLSVPGEQLWQVPPLPVDGPAEADGPLPADAVRLFADRARLVQHDFALGGQRTALASQICRRLDGIPLAIELVASRMHVLGLEGIASQLGERFQLFSTESRGVPLRHRTLQAAIDWSYELLTVPQQELLRQLSVFAGGWTLAAAESIWNSVRGRQQDEALNLLASLVDRSLVQAEPGVDGLMRYRLLETIREYAVKQLRTRGEESTIRHAHAECYLNLVEEAEPELWGPRPEPRLKQLEADLDNCRAALLWSITAGEEGIALRLGAPLGRFWLVAGRYHEGQAWVTRLLNLSSSDEATPIRAKLLRSNASLWAYQGAAAVAEPFARAALELTRRCGSEMDLARSLIVLGETVQTRGDFAGARRILEEAIAVSRGAGADVALVDALHYLGGDALASDDFHRAGALGDECLSIARRVGYSRGIARALRTLGSISYIERDRETARLQLEASIAAALDLADMWEVAQARALLGHLEADEGDYAASVRQLARMLEIGRQLGDKEIFCTFLEGAAHLAAVAGDAERALRLAGAAASQREAIDSILFPILVRLMDGWLAAPRASLGESVASSAIDAGRLLSLEQAVAEACVHDSSLGNEVAISGHRPRAGR